MRREGKWVGIDRDARTAHLGVKSVARLRPGSLDIPHGDRVACGRAETAGRNPADWLAFGIDQVDAVSYGLATLGFEADTLLMGSRCQDSAQRLGAEKSAAGADILRDRP